VSRTIAQGKSVVWSPDGKFVAYVRGGRIGVVTLVGAPGTGSTIPTGQIVISNSPNPELARSFWAVDSQTGNQIPLPTELSSKSLDGYAFSVRCKDRLFQYYKDRSDHLP
jgi:hypothetical protein